ncbi:polyprenyl synthetase [Thermotoga maritima MSB8]|uniref:Octoprenyl-diphosphate synthase, putative n=1 Tax=Thermotoga maritima (strain ATCC 43589 / DSM 3109 / JCM 10099 / NBRC 100826 / MSB8) TaxID=243274 RepID=Q9X1M1_THEMA|nr:MULTISPECIES: polyprenyl synthetase family protein [Thermotoga]1V4E_A Chain A, octoprenyl-diphosphate synthase [Thermotoga maritima]1V4E_B Chain B, octoprenyl-diphosphate synthase [Thermotoga maritima]AAD36602.1 octoprenyl-diphosphate synthase, putative [Thermotoga maritima MSB8]ACB09542.1 Polyprenyl synthetase [Thermotoga sp. RQ2]AGL50467.1 Chain A of octaprenyl pyrophosphate synthase [Thermotoga maritima MSB8]AHD18567.1 Polyprenyl synthetase [Thermotoga maritima MSB8]AKE27424.1 polypren
MTKNKLNQNSYELEKVKERIEQILSQFFPEQIMKDLPLYGKMLRVRLSILSFKNRGVEIGEDAISSLAALELVHLASLLHDDVIDGARFRRGKETINFMYGDKAAVAAGDLVLVSAFHTVEEIGNNKLRRAFLNVIGKMSEAELIEQLSRYKPITKEEYLRIVEGKSGALFGLALQLPALLEGELGEDLYNLGVTIGTIYQMFDDIMDFAGMEKIGKDGFLDLKNGVASFPLVTAMEKFPEARQMFENRDWSGLMSFMREKGILKECEETLKVLVKNVIIENSWLRDFVDGIFKIKISS